MIFIPLLVLQLKLLLITAMILVLPLFILWAKQRNALKNAGINPNMPGCSNCLYILRGWESSVCPECGIDADKTSVRIGMKLNIYLKVFTALGISLLVVVFVLIPLGNWMFTTTGAASRLTFKSMGDNEFKMRIVTFREYRHFLSIDKITAMLIIEPEFENKRASESALDNYSIEQLLSLNNKQFRTYHFDNVDELPTDQEMAVLIGEAIGHDSNSMKIYAVEINSLLNQAYEWSKSPDVESVEPLFDFYAGGSGMHTYLWKPGVTISIIVIAFMVILPTVLVVKRHKPGTRPVQNGEWLTSADPEITTN